MADRRRVLIALAIFLAVVVLCGSAVAVVGFLFRDQLLALFQGTQARQAAEILPEGTEVLVSLDLAILDHEDFRNLQEIYLDNPDVRSALDDLDRILQEGADISIEEDIQPWIGSQVVLAVPSLRDIVRATIVPPDVVVAAATRDREASDRFVAKLLAAEEREGRSYDEEDYQGVTLYVRQTSADEAVLATFSDWVVGSNSVRLVKEMVDLAVGTDDRPSLADNPAYGRVLSLLPAGPRVTFFLAPSDIIESLSRLSPVEFPQEQTQDLEALEAAAVAGTFQGEGIRFDAVATYDVERMTDRVRSALEQPASPNAVLQNVPADALLVLNGQNLSTVWSQVAQGLEGTPDFEETLADLEASLGFNIEEDVFSWMTGEWAFVLVEAPSPDPTVPPVGAYALIGTDDVEEARRRVENVIGAFGPLALFLFEEETIGGVEMTVFTDEDGRFLVGYGFFEEYFLIAYLEESAVAATGASRNPLTDSLSFRAMRDRLPSPNTGYVYANVDSLRELLAAELSGAELRDYKENAEPFLEPIHAVGSAGEAGTGAEGIIRAVLFVLVGS
ncbi:MAG: DUF3352 domain-containing protein [Anaerolineae bacterium]